MRVFFRFSPVLVAGAGFELALGRNKIKCSYFHLPVTHAMSATYGKSASTMFPSPQRVI